MIITAIIPSEYSISLSLYLCLQQDFDNGSRITDLGGRFAWIGSLQTAVPVEVFLLFSNYIS